MVRVAPVGTRRLPVTTKGLPAAVHVLDVASIPLIALTVVVTVDELLLGFGSPLAELTVAVLVSVLPAAAMTFTTSVTEALPPLLRVPSLHVTGPTDGVHVPWVGVALTKVVPVGTFAVATT